MPPTTSAALRSRLVRSLECPLIQNIPYRPSLAPVEHAISVIKNEFKKRRLQKYAEGRPFFARELIKDVMRKQNNGTFKRMMTKKMLRWRQLALTDALNFKFDPLLQ